MATTTEQRQRRWARPPAAAKYLGTTTNNLATLRCRDPDRIPFHRLGGGRTILYDLNELDDVVLAGNAK